MCHNRSSGKVKLQTDLAKPRMPHDRPEASFLFGVEHEKSASAGADKFASESAISSREFIEPIDLAAAHAGGSLFLVLPMHVHQIGELVQVRVQQRLPALHTQLFGEVKVLDHLRVVLFGS